MVHMAGWLAASAFMAFCALGKSQYQVMIKKCQGDVAVDDPGKIALVQIKNKATKTNPFDMVWCSMWAGLVTSYVWYTDYI